MDDRRGNNMFGNPVAAVGVLIVAACTLYAVWSLGVVLMSH
jgi:hypothetical protein